MIGCTESYKRKFSSKCNKLYAISDSKSAQTYNNQNTLEALQKAQLSGDFSKLMKLEENKNNVFADWFQSN